MQITFSLTWIPIPRTQSSAWNEKRFSGSTLVKVHPSLATQAGLVPVKSPMQIHPPAQCKLSTAFLWSQRWAPANAICGGSWGHAICNEIEEENNVRIYTCSVMALRWRKTSVPCCLALCKTKPKYDWFQLFMAPRMVAPFGSFYYMWIKRVSKVRFGVHKKNIILCCLSLSTGCGGSRGRAALFRILHWSLQPTASCTAQHGVSAAQCKKALLGVGNA